MKGKRVYVRFEGELLVVCQSLTEAAIKTNISCTHLRGLLDSGRTCRGYSFDTKQRKEK